MTRLVLRCLLAVLAPAVLLQLHVAHAQPAPDKAKLKTARSYVDAGLAAQNAGDHDTAITFYTKAYELAPHPLLLFNLAQAHRLAKREDEAIELYRQFLATRPTGPEARLARDLLAELEKRKAEEARKAEIARNAREADEARQARETREADEAREADDVRKTDKARKAEKAREASDATEPSQPPLQPERSPWYRDPIGDVLLLGGVTGLVLGGLAYRAAAADLDLAETAVTHAEAVDLVDAARTKRLAGVVLAGAGVALAGAAVLRFVLRDGRTEARRVGIAPARGGGLLTWTRSF